MNTFTVPEDYRNYKEFYDYAKHGKVFRDGMSFRHYETALEYCVCVSKSLDLYIYDNIVHVFEVDNHLYVYYLLLSNTRRSGYYQVFRSYTCAGVMREFGNVRDFFENLKYHTEIEQLRRFHRDND